MAEHALALIGAIVVARAAFHEIHWRMTRDPSGNSGRFGKHWSDEK